VQNSSRLALYHYWVAFAAFLPAVLLGAWQMLMRSPLPAPLDDPNAYYTSVTLHGTAMAYVITTFFAMGFGYAVTATSLGRPVRGVIAAWIGFVICLVGTVMAVVTVLLGRATVLYTFYPPLLASAWYYFGALLLIGGSMIWVALMIFNMSAWKRDNPGQPVPLAMFAITATAILWAWAASGVIIELLFVLIPQALGLTTQIDVGLGRTLFTVTLHAIVYFWLMPAYIAFYTLVPQAAGGRLYSDTMGRLTFIMFLLFSLPVGMHHLFADPEYGSGFKFVQSVLTFMVALPTLLTVFTITASLEIAGRVRGGKGLFGWIRALPWDEPMVLAVGLSLLLLGPGGFGGLINMSFAMNAMIHNTSWVTAHFHLIFGGAVVIVYFAIAYELWPRLTGRPLVSKRLAYLQLWIWFWGILITTIPWHIAGLMGGLLGGPMMARAFRVALVLGGMMSAFGMFNALVMSYSRVPLAMAQDGMLPKVFAKMTKRTDAPWVSIVVLAVCWAPCLLLGFERLVSLDVLLYGMSLTLEFVALVALRIKEPELKSIVAIFAKRAAAAASKLIY